MRPMTAAAVAACLGLLVMTEPVRTQEVPARLAWRPTLDTVPSGEVRVLPVRGNVYMIVGAGGNITVHAGNDGVLLVDSGTARMTDKVLAAIRGISRGPLRYIVNTTEQEEYNGGNDVLAAQGATIRFRIATDPRVSDGLAKDRASVVSFLTLYDRMSAPAGQVSARPEEAWPDNTFSTPQKKLYFNDEPVLIMHNAGATDGNSIVHFRYSDVISVGGLFDMTTYPYIDSQAGGSVDSVVKGLTRLFDLTVPNRKSEAGTLIIPGKGRLADQPDVVYYQQMVAIIRDRVQDMKARGMTLQQIKAERPTRDYDPRYGRTTGPWTTDMFVEAVYNSLKK